MREQCVSCNRWYSLGDSRSTLFHCPACMQLRPELEPRIGRVSEHVAVNVSMKKGVTRTVTRFIEVSGFK